MLLVNQPIEKTLSQHADVWAGHAAEELKRAVQSADYGSAAADLESSSSVDEVAASHAGSALLQQLKNLKLTLG